MSTLSPTAVTQALKWRYATKAFDPAKKIPADVWATLETSLVLAPSSFGLQPWKFVVVTNPAVREKLKPAAFNQGQVTDCSHYVVIARRTSVTQADVERFFESISSITKAPPAALAGYKGMVSGFVANPQIDTALWATKQTYIALGFLLETAALLGVDACPMEGFNPAAFDEILGLPALGYNATVTCALGYRSPNDKHANDPKVRYPATEVVLHV